MVPPAPFSTTESPEQKEGFAGVMEAVGIAVTVMVMVFEVAVLGTAQGALEVKITVITSPLFNVLEVKVFELVPAFTPFTCH